MTSIYRWFVEDERSETEIACRLNLEGILTDLGRAWTRGTVHQILINEKYVGNNVWNRSSCKLKQKRIVNDMDMWVRLDGGVRTVVNGLLFDAAQA